MLKSVGPVDATVTVTHILLSGTKKQLSVCSGEPHPQPSQKQKKLPRWKARIFAGPQIP